MGLFDFFKKNKHEQTVTKVAQRTGVESTTHISESTTKDKGTFVKNGLIYHIVETMRDGYLMSESIPEYNEVYVFYTFLNKYPIIKKPDMVRECDYAHWVFAKIGIEIVGNVHKGLYEKGFYTKASNRSTLSTMKVGEIKDVIAQLSLNLKGKKEDLIDDLISQVDEATLASLLDSSMCMISDYGKQWMREHELEYDFYSSDEEYSSFEEYKKIRGVKSKDDVLRENCILEIKNDKKQFGRYAYDTLIGFLEKEGNMREVVICYLKELLIDLSGALHYADWQRGHFDKEIIKMLSDVLFTDFLIRTFPKYKDYYTPDMINEAYSLPLPIKACSIKEFKDVAEMMFDGTMDASTREQYEKRLQAKIIRIGMSLPQ